MQAPGDARFPIFVHAKRQFNYTLTEFTLFMINGNRVTFNNIIFIAGGWSENNSSTCCCYSLLLLSKTYEGMSLRSEFIFPLNWIYLFRSWGDRFMSCGTIESTLWPSLFAVCQPTMYRNKSSTHNNTICATLPLSEGKNLSVATARSPLNEFSHHGTWGMKG